MSDPDRSAAGDRSPTQEEATEHDHDHPSGAPERPRVLLFYDYACPFCYVDQFRFDRLHAERPDVDFVLVPFELRPDMPEEGYKMSELEASGMGDRIEDHLLRIAERDGFPLQIPPFLPKTHKAHTLAEIGRDAGDEMHMALHRAIFGAYFGEGKDISSEDVLFEIADEAGVAREQLVTAWADDSYGERLHQFRHVAMHLGLDATPAALICNELVIGSRPYEVLKESLDRCLVTAETLETEVQA